MCDNHPHYVQPEEETEMTRQPLWEYGDKTKTIRGDFFAGGNICLGTPAEIRALENPNQNEIDVQRIKRQQFELKKAFKKL